VFDVAARLFDTAMCNDTFRTTIAERMPRNALAVVLGHHHCVNNHVPEDDDEDLSFLRVTSACAQV
jgi:hypothetical protein